jgi:hypothetical protein
MVNKAAETKASSSERVKEEFPWQGSLPSLGLYHMVLLSYVRELWLGFDLSVLDPKVFLHSAPG